MYDGLISIANRYHFGGDWGSFRWRRSFRWWGSCRWRYNASPYGVRAVISHVMDDVEECPIALPRNTQKGRKELLANREESPGNCIWCPEVSQVSIRSTFSPVNRSQAISDHLGSSNSSTYFSSGKNAALGSYSAGVQLSGGVSLIRRAC